MDSWITEHWSDFVYWLFILIVSSVGGKIVKELKHTRADFAYIKNGILATLKDRLYQGCQHFIKQGWCTVDDLESMECIYKSYHELGGNGTGTNLFERMKHLELRDKEDN